MRGCQRQYQCTWIQLDNTDVEVLGGSGYSKEFIKLLGIEKGMSDETLVYLQKQKQWKLGVLLMLLMETI